MENNTNIMRRELGKERLKTIQKIEEQEIEIQKRIQSPEGQTRYRCYDPEGVGKVRPVKAIEKLIGLSKTQQNWSPGMAQDQISSGSRLIEKLRRNKMSLNTTASDYNDLREVVTPQQRMRNKSSLFSTAKPEAQKLVDPKQLYYKNESRFLSQPTLQQPAASTHRTKNNLTQSEETFIELGEENFE